jgi:hypothetical protein
MMQWWKKTPKNVLACLVVLFIYAALSKVVIWGFGR